MAEGKVEPGTAAARRLLAATDLSTRSERALRRAAILARQLGAHLLLHVVDDDQPAGVVEAEVRQAAALLRRWAAEPTSSGDGPPETLVEVGGIAQTIVAVAEARDVGLVVMGAHRRRVLRDVFTGTTVERVMRTGRRPVLMVGAEPVGRYRSVLVAVDLSEASANAVRASRGLGLLDGADLVRGPRLPAAREGHDVLRRNRGRQDRQDRGVHRPIFHRGGGSARVVPATAGPRDRELHAGSRRGCAVRWDHAGRGAVRPDLLVIGTRGHAGIRRVLLGSVADQVLREIECNVLAVPPAGPRPA